MIGSTLEGEGVEGVDRTRKRIKQEQEEGEGWIVVKKKDAQLSVSICDFSKVNRFYSHKSLQNYIRYILVQSVPNPMWLSIKRQSLIQRIIYVDLEIENNLFEKLLSHKELPFLSSLGNESNIAKFKGGNKIFREELWECLLGYETEQNIQEIASNKNIQEPAEIS